MKSTAPFLTTLAVLFAAAAPMQARGAVGPAMGGYSAGAVFEGVELPSYGWLRYGYADTSWRGAYREPALPFSAVRPRSHRGHWSRQ